MRELILVPVDGSEQSFKALEVANRLIGDSGAELELLHVVPEHQLPEGLAQWAAAEHVRDVSGPFYEKTVAQGLLQSADAIVGAGKKPRHRIEYGDAARRILDVAKEDGVTQIVMGTHGLSRWRGMVMGSTAQKVMLGATCPVITVRP